MSVPERGHPSARRRGPPGTAAGIAAVLADITTLEVDAVVNAANRSLAGGGGVDGAIHRAAGAAALRAACADLGGCEPGDAKATPGFALAARWIVHTVGPVWSGGGRGEQAVLASCYRRAFEVAESLGAASLAYPAISTGVYGFPSDEAALIAVDTLRSMRSAVVREVLLVAYDDATFERYRRLLAAG
jgi:O-acetyl-ADP-ribose deacetylase